MKLHEKIYTLRTAKKLSQGDLAEMLDVSRQSVSKWETGASVPDLDKLMKMSDLFGVTLDALVHEEMYEKEPKITENTQKNEENDEKTQNIVILKEPISVRKMIGIMFFGMAFVAFLVIGIVSDFMIGLLCAAFLCVLGTVCFVAAKRTAYWCVCAVYLAAKLLFPHAVGVGLSVVGVILLIPMLIWTLYQFREFRFYPTLKQKFLYVGGWGIYVLFPTVYYLVIHFMQNDAVNWARGGFVALIWQGVSPIVLGGLLVYTAAWIRAYREKKNI